MEKNYIETKIYFRAKSNLKKNDATTPGLHPGHETLGHCFF